MDFLMNQMLKTQPNYAQIEQNNQLPKIQPNQNLMENKQVQEFYQAKPNLSQLVPEQKSNMFLTSYLLLQNLAQQNKVNNEPNNISQIMIKQMQDQAQINFANSFLKNLLTQTQKQQQNEEKQLTEQNQQNYENFKKLQNQWQSQFIQQQKPQQPNSIPIQNQCQQIKQTQPILLQQPLKQNVVPQELLEKKSKKIKKQNTKCGHIDREHYAKGMCNPCYHRFGRSKHPTLCAHSNAKLYAHGLCQNCYINNYNKVKREGLTQQIQDTIIKQEPEDNLLSKKIISEEN